MRIATRLPLVLLLVVLAALVAGCGSGDSSSEKTGDERKVTTEQSDDAAPEGKLASIDATLDVVLEGVGGKDSLGIEPPATMKCTKSIPARCSTTVECPADPGDDDQAELCSWLATIGRAILESEPDPNQACTMQYGGSATATVTGTLDGQPIKVELSRQDGCAIDRFDQVSPLWTGEVTASPIDAPPSAGGNAASGSCPALPPDAPVSSDQPSDPAAGAADGVCTSSATPAPGTPTLPPGAEPEVISDPPEAFER